ncbi:FKBP-type peptidyl-prolyl cis-trans isomerase [Bradymonas sediminis]|nr:peptidylprolyl isomerase [Bradymonas sediminis]TDP62185.1 FKBP-type peptidyl prolyl cis-trans isomerase /apo-metallochaperone SlyD [Bradymonas sediminis]
MKVAANRVVGLRYILRDVNTDEELHRRDEDDIFYYLHGFENIIPGMERVLEGCAVGDTFDVEFEPEDAYGEYNPKLAQTVSRDEFPDDFELEVDMIIELVPQEAEDDDEGQLFRIKEVGEKEVLIDGNAPLAGKKIGYRGEVVEVREADPDELAHGHVHTDDCDHHDH